jgi:hypothetical protein
VISATIIHHVNSTSAKRFEAATRDPRGAQERKLFGALRQNAETEYGRRHGFGSISTVEEYQRNVPVITYKDIQDGMDRVAEGESNVFTAEDPVMFAQTSGTTGKPKFIPVTPTDKGREQSDVMRTWLWHAREAHRDIWDGKIVTLVSPAIEGYTSSGLPYGSTSGHMYRNLPAIVKRLYSIPYEVFEIEDYEAKYYAIMRTSLEDPVRFLCTANPSSVLKMCEKANEYSERIIGDIRDGSLAADMHIEPEIREVLERRYRPNPRRAKELEDARSERAGRLIPADYWPRMSLIACWKGGTVGHYIDKFMPWFDPDGDREVPVRDWGYLSSECRGSVPLSDEGSKGCLTIASNFFEFVEADTLEGEDWTKWDFKTADQIEMGREYYIFVTTTSGLYRYDINDIVRVEGRYNGTPEIVFVRKGRGMTNITGEKLSVSQVIDAVNEASAESGATAAHFKAEADKDNGRYIVRVEPAKTYDYDTLLAFLKGVDGHLKRLNIEYEAKRKSERLHPPVLHVMREGWYERQRKAQVAEGKRAFQAKTELLSPSKLATTKIRPELVEVIEMEG